MQPRKAVRDLFACALVALVAFGGAAIPAWATEDAPQLLEADAAIVLDQAGNVLWDLNADERMEPASITKVMTAMVALDSGMDLDTVCGITAVDLGPDSQTAGYTQSDTPTLRELLQVMLVYSGNDAAYNVAVNVAGSEEAFVDLMNAKAAELGLANTHFANSHGLEADGHYSCARDLAAMGRYALTNYPFIAEAVRYEGLEVTVGGQVVWLGGTDELMGVYEGLLGIKTGAVAAGKTFLGASRRGEVTLYSAVLGCETSEGRFADTVALMDWAYGTFRQDVFVPAGWTLRVSPYALGFRAKCLVLPTTDYGCTAWPGEPPSRSATIVPAGLLVEPGDTYSYSWWRQSGRLAGAADITVSDRLVQAPSVNVFALPLFMGADALA